MIIFGHPISLTLVLQLATTAIILGLYAVTTSLHEQKSDHISTCNMIIFVSFLFGYHPTVKDLNALMGRPKDQQVKQGSDLYYFGPRVSAFIKNGTLPDFAIAAKTNLREHLYALALAPLAAVMLAAMEFKDGRNNTPRIVHTEYRKNASSKYMFLFAANLLIAVVTAELLMKWTPRLGAVLTIVGLVGVLASMICIALIVAQQQTWKAYWGDRLLEIMAVAEHEKNHDLFNRAMILNSYVDSQPDVPIPGRLGLYTAVYSGVQAVILFAAKSLHFS